MRKNESSLAIVPQDETARPGRNDYMLGIGYLVVRRSANLTDTFEDVVDSVNVGLT